MLTGGPPLPSVAEFMVIYYGAWALGVTIACLALYGAWALIVRLLTQPAGTGEGR